MADFDSLLRVVGWVVIFVGGCLILYPAFSLLARLGARDLDRLFEGTYVVTGGLFHLPIWLVLGLLVTAAGFHVLGRADHRNQADHPTTAK